MSTPADKETNQDVVAIDPDFGAMAIRIGTETFSQEGLTPLDCAFLCLANDVCQHLFGLPFQLHVQLVLSNGGTFGQVKEVLLHLGPHAGMALVLEALVRLKELYPQFNQEEQAVARVSPGAFPVFEAASREALSALDARFATFAQREIEQVWQRGGLTPWQRASLSLAVDVVYQTLGEPFHFHVDLALRTGASVEQIRSVLRFLEECSLPKVWQAFEVLNRLLETRGVQ
jgi:4-carboxymuconolactone decarboxylase